jgi:hypothetical protein
MRMKLAVLIGFSLPVTAMAQTELCQGSDDAAYSPDPEELAKHWIAEIGGLYEAIPNRSRREEEWLEKELSEGDERRFSRATFSGSLIPASHYVRRDIDYTNFGELGEIVRNNWEHFDTIFSSMKAFSKIMTSLNMLRGPIAHCCPLSEDEVVRLQLTVRDWFRLME